MRGSCKTSWLAQLSSRGTESPLADTQSRSGEGTLNLFANAKARRTPSPRILGSEVLRSGWGTQTPFFITRLSELEVEGAELLPPQTDDSVPLPEVGAQGSTWGISSPQPGALGSAPPAAHPSRSPLPLADRSA